jgi:hypothetical protein
MTDHNDAAKLKTCLISQLTKWRSPSRSFRCALLLLVEREVITCYSSAQLVIMMMRKKNDTWSSGAMLHT